MLNRTYFDICRDIFQSSGIYVNEISTVLYVNHGSIVFVELDNIYIPHSFTLISLKHKRSTINFDTGNPSKEKVARFAKKVVAKVRAEKRYREYRKRKIDVACAEAKLHSMPLHSILSDLFPDSKNIEKLESGAIQVSAEKMRMSITPLIGDKPYHIAMSGIRLSNDHLEKFLQLMKEANVIS